MSDKSLKDKAVNIGGKMYVQVADRLKYFNEVHPKGSIETELVHITDTAEPNPLFVVRAIVSVDGQKFTGLSQARLGGKMANKEAALENAETSAVGRALAFMGIGVIDAIASADELKRAGVKIVKTSALADRRESSNDTTDDGVSLGDDTDENNPL